MNRDGLTSAQLERGRVYRCTAPLALSDGEPIKIKSIGPRYVRYCEWLSDWPGWCAPRRHPRVIFDSWDGWWQEMEDPSA
jgi:hypothetical protein